MLNSIELKRVKMKKYYQNNKERLLKRYKQYYLNNKGKIQEYYRKWCYGLDNSEYQKIVQKQNGRCSLCNKKAKLSIDHCHKTGKVRGLLCNVCNMRVVPTFEKYWNIKDKILAYIGDHYASGC